MLAALLMKLRGGDVALTVPAPIMLPYAFAAAAKLKGAKSVLIMHDLSRRSHHGRHAEAQSMLAKAMRALNGLMFRALDAVVIIGRDTECCCAMAEFCQNEPNLIRGRDTLSVRQQ